MSLFQFAKSAGRKLGLLAEEPAAPAAPIDARAARDQLEQRNRQIARELEGEVRANGLQIADLAIGFAAGKAILEGRAASQADREKAVLVVGNTAGVDAVDDRLRVEIPAPPGIFHTVEEGDTLATIAARYYGIMRLFDGIFEANKPMLQDPDEIYPGQVLRIPRVTPPVHTVAKGETLGSIAKYWYGDAKKYSAIHIANGTLVTNPNAIEVGWALIIPAKGEAIDLPPMA